MKGAWHFVTLGRFSVLEVLVLGWFANALHDREWGALGVCVALLFVTAIFTARAETQRSRATEETK